MRTKQTAFSLLSPLTKMAQGSKNANPGSNSIIRRNSFCRNVSYYFTKYTEHTSIHGLKFLGERNRSLIEKIFWSLFLATSLFFCATLMLKTYQKWERSPVIVSFATSETAISHVPFPAVTICPQVKSSKNIFDFSKMGVLKNNNSNVSKLRDEEYSYMFLVCSNKHSSLVDIGSKVTMNDEVINYLLKVQPKFNQNIECYFAGSSCSHIYQSFKPIITSEGVCYSFNMLDRDEIFTSKMAKGYYEHLSIEHQQPSAWGLETGYTNKSILGVFPCRSVASGEDGGLTLILKDEDINLDYVCGNGLQGYKVILHHPAQMPNAKQGFFRIGLNQFATAAIKPSMMTTSKELEDYKPDTRKCYFVAERSLKFFKTYNQHDCILECFANFTYQYCHCVEFFMPRDNSTPICGPHDGKCVVEATNEDGKTVRVYSILITVSHLPWSPHLVANKFLAKDLNLNPHIVGISHRIHAIGDKPIIDCNCLKACYSLNFGADVSQVGWNWREGKKIVYPQRDTNGYHLTKLQIFYKDTQFITSERHELYGQADFFANCGGLLGLFCGFSLISLGEILYFITLRLVCNLRKYGRHQWSEADTETESEIGQNMKEEIQA